MKFTVGMFRRQPVEPPEQRVQRERAAREQAEARRRDQAERDTLAAAALRRAEEQRQAREHRARVEQAGRDFEAAVKKHRVLFPGDSWQDGRELNAWGVRRERWRDAPGLRGVVGRLFDV
jgi:hypothetical protein